MTLWKILKHIMKTKIRTISDINFTGKWVEYWFEEEKDIRYDEYLGEDKDNWINSTKNYMLENLVNEADLERHIYRHGYVGLKTEWEDDGVNWNLLRIFK